MMTTMRESRECYETKMGSNIIEDQSVPVDTIQEWHNEAVAEAIALFEKKKKLGSQGDIEARRRELEEVFFIFCLCLVCNMHEIKYYN